MLTITSLVFREFLTSEGLESDYFKCGNMDVLQQNRQMFTWIWVCAGNWMQFHYNIISVVYLVSLIYGTMTSATFVSINLEHAFINLFQFIDRGWPQQTFISVWCEASTTVAVAILSYFVAIDRYFGAFSNQFPAPFADVKGTITSKRCILDVKSILIDAIRFHNLAKM